ncbi:MAG: lasso peptide biosynthesis protein [Fimbriimonadaceae bacterium]|nr:lasso peptide biosynthesis protein [Fimbriimonadaceae bacterium]
MNSNRFLRSILILSAFCLSLSGFAQEAYLGLFLQGSKIGYVHSKVDEDTSTGKKMNRATSETMIDMSMLGTPLNMRILTYTLSDQAGKPLVMKFTTISAGRSQNVEANFIGNQIRVVVDNNGERSNKVLEIPKGGVVVDDPVSALLTDQVKPGAKAEFYVLDTTAISLIKNSVEIVGPATVDVRGKSRQATLVKVIDPRATMSVYLDSKNEVIKIDAMAGIEMIPVTKEEALAEVKPGSIDLAEATSLRPNKPLSSINTIKSLSLKISGPDMSRVPTTDHQTVKGSAKTWQIAIHPVEVNTKTTIAQAAKQQPNWLKPGLHIPSDQQSFKALAKQIIGDSKTVADASSKIRKYVSDQMTPNAGIGVLRDANEILKTKEGVCRDYAILSATLLRAAGIPTRVCSGLVYQDGTYYYHAWDEVWDGAKWFGVDSTRPDGRVRAGHLTLAKGTVEDAFLFTFLDKATIEVVDIVRR